MKIIEKIKIKNKKQKLTQKFRKENEAHLLALPEKPYIIGNPAIDGDFELCRKDEKFREAKKEYLEWYNTAFIKFLKELQKLSDEEKLLD